MMWPCLQGINPPYSLQKPRKLLMLCTCRCHELLGSRRHMTSAAIKSSHLLHS